MELIHSDVVGPIPVKGFDGSKYFVTFECDKTKLAAVYCMKSKGEVTDCFIHFKKHFERVDLGWTIKRLHDDNGGEYIAGRLQRFIFQEGILWEATEPYTPQMNGPSERLGQTIWRKAAPLLKFAGIPLDFWPEAVKHAAYLYNRSIHSAIKISPFQARYSRIPRYSHINVFGSVVYYNNPGHKKKLRDETVRGILVGYEGDTICRILKPNGRIARGAAVKTIERMLWEQFDPTDTEPNQLMDHFTNVTQPGKVLPLQKPVSLPLPDPFSSLKRKYNPVAKPASDLWFNSSKELVEHHQIAPSFQLPSPNLPQPSYVLRSPASVPSLIRSSPADVPSLLKPFSEPIAPLRTTLSQTATPGPSRPKQEPQGRAPSTVLGRRTVSTSQRPQTERATSSPLALGKDAFWYDKPPPRERREREVKQEINYKIPGASDIESVFDQSPVRTISSSPPEYIPEYVHPSIEDPTEDEEEDEDEDWHVIQPERHPELRQATALEKDDESESFQPEDIERVTPPNHPELRAATPLSDSPDPLSLLMIPRYVASTNHCSLLTFLGHMDSIEPFEPKTLQQAMDSPQWKHWKAAIEDEYNSLVENKTWSPMPLPANRQALSGKWVFKLKRGAHGEILRYKARWVVRGFEQREGLDFTETFASVVKPMSYKAIFALAAAYDWEIEQMDVKTAFLYGDIEEDVWVELPTGCGVSGSVKLNKALYGLKQSPRVWYNTLATYLATLGFKPLDADASVFCKDGTIIAIYVDDLLLASESVEDIKSLKEALNVRFKMSDLGACHFYLGMEVIRDRPRRQLRLSQEAYLQKVLTDHGMENCNGVQTPMETSSRLVPADPDYQADRAFRTKYQSAVGSLMYAMLGTRPDIAYAVSVVSRFASNPNTTHMNAVKRILKYLKETIHLGLVYHGSLQPLIGYTDSDFAGDPHTRRSTSGYVFNLGSAAISWSSKRQATVSLSSCEAEYIGQTNATKEAVWLQAFLRQLQPDKDPGVGATVIYADNQGAIALAKNQVFHGRTKHIEMHYHFVREKISDGTVELRYISTSEQVADGLTKALCRDKFQAFRRAVGVE